MVWYSISSACCVHRVMCLCLCEWLLRRRLNISSIHSYVRCFHSMWLLALFYLYLYLYLYLCLCFLFFVCGVSLFVCVYFLSSLWGLRVCPLPIHQSCFIYPSINRVLFWIVHVRVSVFVSVFYVCIRLVFCGLTSGFAGCQVRSISSYRLYCLLSCERVCVACVLFSLFGFVSLLSRSISLCSYFHSFIHLFLFLFLFLFVIFVIAILIVL